MRLLVEGFLAEEASSLRILLRNLNCNRLCFGIGFQSIFSEFSSSSRLAESAERSGWVQNIIAINPNGSGRQLVGKRESTVDVFGSIKKGLVGCVLCSAAAKRSKHIHDSSSQAINKTSK